jgi:GNAT superfamily N-acetyltransferase
LSPGDLLERAAPGELERGVEAGDVWVVECAEGVVGYAHLDRQCRSRFVVAGLVVVPSRRGHRLGTSLLAAALESVDLGRTPVCAVTSPENLVMLNLLFARGFVGRWALPGYFGPALHRVGLQLRVSGSSRPGEVGWRQSSGLDTWAEVVSAGCAVIGVNSDGGVPLLGVTPSSALDLMPCPPPRYPGRR